MNTCEKLVLGTANIKTAPSIRHIIPAISEEAENRGLVAITNKHWLSYVLGDQHDVFGRIIKATEHHDSKYILRTTIEDPLMLYKYVDFLVHEFLKGDYDWAGYGDTLEGTGVEFMKMEPLRIFHKDVLNRRIDGQ